MPNCLLVTPVALMDALDDIHNETVFVMLASCNFLLSWLLALQLFVLLLLCH
jgi:hypothetical protein